MHCCGPVAAVLQSVGMRRFCPGPLLTATLLAVLAILAISAAPAPAQDDPDRVLRELQAGERQCSETEREDFVAIGERVMGRQFPSDEAHESMDELMRSMMGERAEQQMHEFLGRRAAGCGGTPPDGFGQMMGMMGSLGGPMMGAGAPGGGTAYPGGMMGRSSHYAGDDDWSAGETVMVVMMGLLVVAAFAAVWMLARRPSQADDSPLDTLRRRYAQGEIDTDEYERRRAALGSSP